MKEYKIIKKGFWKKDLDFEEIINQHARGGWEIKIGLGDTSGNFTKIILERDKNR